MKRPFAAAIIFMVRCTKVAHAALGVGGRLHLTVSQLRLSNLLDRVVWGNDRVGGGARLLRQAAEIRPWRAVHCPRAADRVRATLRGEAHSGTGFPMPSVEFEARSGFRCCLLASAAVVAALTITGDVADARRHHHSRVHHAHASHGHGHRHARLEDYSPPFASIVVDGNSGSVLQAANPDALRHPASLTKVMTLYLLFERLESGRLRLDSALKISEHASEQAPTKLGVKPGQTISVEEAIKGMVTKSANDAAVAVAESLGGDEDNFAKLMTQKARALGMARTVYVNASGLPGDDQVTTARDQAILGRAIQERFPRYYRYFSTESFVYHGQSMRNHNHLLGAV